MITYSRTLFWAPRALSIAFIAFLSMFALDVFGEGHGFWQTLADLAMHLIPTFILAAGLAIAWRWEWVGAVEFTAFAIVFLVIVRSPFWGKAIFAAPCLATAWLFLIGWRKRREHSATTPAAPE